MKRRDMREWMVKDNPWSPAYEGSPHDEEVARVEPAAFEQVLDSAAISGDSAFLGICFDFDNRG